jgi:hypothetical protein
MSEPKRAPMCRTEKTWNKIEAFAEKHFLASMLLAVGLPLGFLCLIPYL